MGKKKNPLIIEVIRKCRELDFIRSEIPGGVVVEIPTPYQFQRSLPEKSPERHQAIYESILEDLRRNFDVREKDGQVFYGRFRLWQTGRFAKAFGSPKPETDEEKRLRIEKSRARELGEGKSDAMFRRLPGSFGANQ